MKNPSPLLFLLFSIPLLVQTDGAGYGAPVPFILAPPPPFEVAGKPFPPQSFVCNSRGSPCYEKRIQCPKQCPEFKPADPKAKACFIDCKSPKCEAVCRHRKPNCEGIGAACYDPRFVGGDGIVFYFHGKSNEHFSLVSDSNIHINARFIGRRPAGRPRDNTWIQSLGFLFGSHSFSLSATTVASWDESVDHLSLSYDSSPLSIPFGHLSSWSALNSELVIERTASVNSIFVTLPSVFEISATVVPITDHDNRIHNYQIPDDDCFAHLEVQFRFFNLSDRVEGVLGQTYRPDFVNPVKRGVSMPIMGGEAKYRTSGLLSTDCNGCIFSPGITTAAETLVLNGAWMGCTSGLTGGRGVVCRR